ILNGEVAPQESDDVLRSDRFRWVDPHHLFNGRAAEADPSLVVEIVNVQPFEDAVDQRNLLVAPLKSIRSYVFKDHEDTLRPEQALEVRQQALEICDVVQSTARKDKVEVVFDGQTIRVLHFEEVTARVRTSTSEPFGRLVDGLLGNVEPADEANLIRLEEGEFVGAVATA